MGFGLGKSAQKGREPFEKKVFEDFDGVVVDARWLPNNQYNSGPQLFLSIANTKPSDKAQRVFLKMGKTLTDYQISEDAMLFSTEAQLNENSGLAKFTSDLESKGVNFEDERFNTPDGVNAAGFLGLKGHFKWVAETFTNANKEETTYERLTLTKFDGFVNVDDFLNKLSGSAPAAKAAVTKLEGVTPELFEAAKELLQVFCMDAKSHTEIIAYAKKQTELATNAALMNAIKERSFLEGLGLTRDGVKYLYKG